MGTESGWMEGREQLGTVPHRLPGSPPETLGEQVLATGSDTESCRWSYRSFPRIHRPYYFYDLVLREEKK